MSHPMKKSVAELFRKFANESLFLKRDELEQLDQETLNRLAKVKFLRVREEFKKLFVDNKVDLSLYPRINKAFGFNDL